MIFLVFFFLFKKCFSLLRAMSMKLFDKKCVFRLRLLLTCESSNVSFWFFISVVVWFFVSFSHSLISLSVFPFRSCCSAIVFFICPRMSDKQRQTKRWLEYVKHAIYSFYRRLNGKIRHTHTHKHRMQLNEATFALHPKFDWRSFKTNYSHEQTQSTHANKHNKLSRIRQLCFHIW